MFCYHSNVVHHHVELAMNYNVIDVLPKELPDQWKSLHADTMIKGLYYI